MADNFYGFDDSDAGEKGKDNLFLWTVFILLLVGVAAACWLGSFYVFSNPQDPRWYSLLRKIKKLEAPKRFEVTAGPPGEFLSPAKLFEKYGKYTRLELQKENHELLVNYLKNFKETKKLTPYMTGKFTVIGAYELKPSDMFASGMVAIAQADDFPQVIIEHVYPAAKGMLPEMKRQIQVGIGMTLVRSNDLAAIVHIEKIPDGRLQFTLVPLLYGVYGGGSFALEPPAELNMKGGVPLTKPDALKSALLQYAEYRRKNPSSDLPGETPVPKQELVRLDTVEPGTKVPESGTLPPMPVATPIAIAGQPTPRRIAGASPTPLPVATPRMAVATPVATPPRVAMLAKPTPRPVVAPPAATPNQTPTAIPVSPSGVPLKPFIASAPAPGTMPTVPGATWRTYAPGRAPTARAITPNDGAALAGRGELGERLYLQGDFRVTASGDSRAVMRDRAATGDPANPSPLDRVRIIVDYPAGAVPPGENAVVSRDASRPFEVRDIRKGLDGIVNITVREIISEP